MNERELLRKIARDYTNLLKENLAGIYVHGSIAFGCFNWEKSDIDFLVVVHEEPALPQKEAMIQTLLALEKSGPPKGFEMSVVLRRYCEAFVYPTPYELHFSVMHLERYQENPEEYVRAMHGEDKDLAAHCMMLRHRGVRLYGPEIEQVFGPVSDEVFEKLKSFFSDSEIVAIVGFATQMIATNNFNSVLKIDVDERLLPIQGEFKPATWRENIK